MKFIKNILSIILLFSASFISPKREPIPVTKQTIQPKPALRRVSKPLVMQQRQQPVAQPKSYAQALHIIKTQMPSYKVLRNNTFTQEFVDFVKSLNLSDIETKALLEAGVNIHAAWTDNNEINKQILSGLHNNIQGIVSTSSSQSIKKSMAQVSISYGMSTDQNKRPYQEDRFTHALVYGNDFFAVYDGHGGDRTSSYLQDNLYKRFTEYRNNKSTIHATFKIAFKKVEDYVLKNFDDGSTVVAVYIDEYNKLHCAWVGDSRAVLESNGDVSFATEDHKPDREDEKKRIEEAGGTIQFYGVWRVNGLAVSRSIGDKSSKSGADGQIIATPEYATVQLNGNNHFMIIASDGLWDVVNNAEAVNLVKDELQKNNALKDIAKLLQNEAIKRGSHDNITVCVLKFEWSGLPKIAPASDTAAKGLPYYIARFRDWLFGRTSK